MQPTGNTKTAPINAYALGTGEIIGGVLAGIGAGVGVFTMAFLKTLGDETAKSTARSAGQARQHGRRPKNTISDEQGNVLLIWPDDITDASVLAILDIKVPIEGGTFRWNPAAGTWEPIARNQTED